LVCFVVGFQIPGGVSLWGFCFSEEYEVSVVTTPIGDA